MSEMAPIESHRFTCSASGCSRSPLPVFFLYSLKAASRIELKSKDEVLDVWHAVDKGMVLATIRLVGMVVKSSGKHEASVAYDLASEADLCPCPDSGRRTLALAITRRDAVPIVLLFQFGDNHCHYDY
jgi:hypothetical protein